MTPQTVAREARDAIMFLVTTGLADDQNLPFLRGTRDGHEVTFGSGPIPNAFLKNIAYEETYDALVAARAFCAKLLDGGLIQIMYEFVGADLVRHRLAYLPSPYLRQYSEDAELYEEDVIYADVVSKRVMPVPLRLDCDARPGVPVDSVHPVAHLTLGQYENCRIPSTAPSGPLQFVEFVLRAFYYPGFSSRSASFPSAKGSFPHSITAAESTMIHVGIPQR